MDKEKELLLNYVGNTLLIEKLYRFSRDLLGPTPINDDEKQLREDMLVAQVQFLEEQNAKIMQQLLKSKKNRSYLRKRTNNFSLEPTTYGFCILSPGLFDTRLVPFVKNYRNVNFLDELEKLMITTIIQRHKERILNYHKNK